MEADAADGSSTSVVSAASSSSSDGNGVKETASDPAEHSVQGADGGEKIPLKLETAKDPSESCMQGAECSENIIPPAEHSVQGAEGGEKIIPLQLQTARNPSERSVQNADDGEISRDPSQDLKIFVCNIQYDALRSAVWTTFEQFGKVCDVYIVTDRATGRSKGYGFVTFEDKISAERALAADSAPLLYLLGREMRVAPARPYKKPGIGGGANAASRTSAKVLKLSDSPLYDHAGGEHIQRLPVELLAHIMSFLPLRQLFLLQRVSQQWHSTVPLCLSMIREVDLKSSFHFIGASRFSDSLLKRILGMMPGLRHIRTKGYTRMCSQNALFIVADCCPNLEELNLNDFSVTERGLKHLCSQCPKLEEIRLPRNYHLSEASILIILCNLNCLRRLDLEKSDTVTGECFSVLPSSVEDLILQGCSKLKSSYLASLGMRGENIKRLNISGLDQLTLEDCCTMLAGMSGLRALIMGNLDLPIDHCIESVGKTLTFLSLTSTKLSDRTLKRMPRMLPQLSFLELDGCLRLTESGLLHLARFQELRYLDLKYIRTVSDAVLDSLLQLSSLASLSLCESSAGPAEFTAAGLTRFIVGSRMLVRLDVGGVSSMTTDVARDASTKLRASRKLDVFAGGTPAAQSDDFVEASNSGSSVVQYGGISVHGVEMGTDHFQYQSDNEYDSSDSDDLSESIDDDFDELDFLDMTQYRGKEDFDYFFDNGFFF